MNVTVFTLPNCQQCRMTEKRLDLLGIPHDVVNLRELPSMPEWAVTAGYVTAPLVRAEREDGTAAHWSGFRPDLIALLVPKEDS